MSRRSKTLNQLAVMGTIAATSGLLLVGGCKSNKDHYSYHAITSDLTPELQGLTERQIDIDTNIAVNENMNWRMLWGDLGRVFFTDQPSILSPYYTVSPSGQPR
jgi:hypothetical protein